MTLAPWRATCLQVESRIACTARNKEDTWKIIDGNLARAVAMIVAACEGPTPPKLVVLPEFAFQGPPRAVPVEDWIARACTTMPGPITDRLADVAKKYGIFIAGNHFEVDPRWPDRYFNSSFCLDPDGEMILRYRRINTASWTSPHDILEDYRAAYGDEGIYPVADTELGRLAIFPCGEISVPEISRMFMMRGAEVLLHPNNEPLSPTSDAAKICRAAENMCYLISANVAGTAGFSDTLTGGHSQIVDFRGQVLSLAEGAEETLECSAMIDIGALQAARRDTGMGNGLMRSRWEMYRSSYGTADFYPANGLAEKAIQTADDFGDLHERALRNLEASGVLRPS
ncbi:nitrilase-related carbon-nitrogen hydrolase [Celeribacter indicus]|uniref:Putative amidohydrolase n=1 Tax=Celeribacter indicus TaxID=1208324 RepID=A0A0B5DX36_9RHOB|nr:nitrilase-related carbon-nitrogen hydrolase [Celeribacter indicus]AJE47584.1 putative amidohydrolase [Celeribacter indicus]SDW11001.1 Predicted amidohydrolase [Celeribacter indicus]